MPALDPRGALAAFCRGAGIDPARLPVQDEAQALQLAGRLLREALLGLKEILRAQQAFQDRNGIECEAPEGRSPLDANMDEYLVELLIGHERRQLDAVMQLRDQFTHAAATTPPPSIRRCAARWSSSWAIWLRSGWPPARMPPPTGTATRMCSATCCRPATSQLPHLFLEALAQAYQDARAKSAG